MRCYWTLVDVRGAPSYFDETKEEQGPRARVGRPGEHWRWVGKHRRDEQGKLVCLYKSPARGADSVRYNRTVERCRKCRRPMEAWIPTLEEWQAYVESRVKGPERHRYWTTKRLGYQPWYAPGFHRKKGGVPGPRLPDGHVEGKRGWLCRYKSRVDRAQWVEGGCHQCGRALPDTYERRTPIRPSSTHA